MKDAPVIIVGGGPAGLIAAEILAKAGKTVHVYDRKASVGRKFLLAGRGGLNLTHSEDLNSFLRKYGEAQTFLSPLIERLTPAMLRQWAEDLGQETFIGSSGRVFPKAMKASPLLRAWLARLDSLGVRFHMQRTWKGWKDQDHLLFQDHSGNEVFVEYSALLLALGGASWPNLGSDGSWADLLKHSGISIDDFQPSNCGFTVAWTDFFKERFAGRPLKSIAITHAGITVPGEAMVDAQGIEGGAIYALSSFIREDIMRNGEAKIAIDLRPSLSIDQLASKLKTPRGRKSFSTYLQKTLNLAPVEIALVHEADRNASSLSPVELASLVKNIPVTLGQAFPIDRAISCAGGIKLDMLDRNMMLRKIPGTFVAGEMLDWEAPTGGYLLQGCFATGAAAAEGVLCWLDNKNAC